MSLGRRLVRPLLRHLFPPGSVRQVLLGPRRGRRFVVEPGLGPGFALGLTAHLHDDFFLARVRPGATVYDVGANRGQVSLLLASLVGDRGRVLSLEPVPALFRSLERNLELNAFDNVDARCLAATEGRGRREFLFDPARSCQGKLADAEPGWTVPAAEVIEVETIALDDLAGEGLQPPSLVKIDVEGGAAAVLRGARELLTEIGPTLYVEIHGPEERAALRDLVMAAGYSITTLIGAPVADPTAGQRGPFVCERGGSSTSP